jgi:hypothetical protein
MIKKNRYQKNGQRKHLAVKGGGGISERIKLPENVSAEGPEKLQ